MNGADTPLEARAEAALCGALLLDEQAAERIADVGLEPRMFADSLCGSVFAVCARLQAAGQPSDVVSVMLELERLGTPGVLAELHAMSAMVPTGAHARSYAERVLAGWQRRCVRDAAEQALAVAQNAELTAQQAVERIQGMFAALKLQSGARSPRRLYDIALERFDRLHACDEGQAEPDGWPVGIPALDRLLGGFRPGHLYVLAARPSVGKSSFAEHLALKLALAGHAALFLSMEMPAEEVADRAIANIGGVSYAALTRGDGAGIAWDSLADGLEAISGAAFWVDDEAALSLAAIRRKAMSKPGLQVLVVDYVQLCATANRQNRAIEIGEISRGLKALAKERDMAVIALSQLNRDVEKRVSPRPTLADLRDSGEIEQDADAVLFLWREGEAKEGQAQQVGCAVEKNRQGSRGAFALRFDGATQRWGESTVPLSERLRKAPSRGFDEG